MAGLVQQSADVRFREIDLSTTLRSRSSSVGAIPIISRKGRTTPYRITNAQDFIAEYGIPNASISFTSYCALDALKEMSDLWCLRIVDPATARHSAAIVKDNGLGVTSIAPILTGIADPNNIDFLSNVSGAELPLMVFTPKSGPGSYANRIAIQIVSDNIAPPTNVQVTSANTGGQLSNGSYEYRVSAKSANGETLASSVATVVIAGVTTTALATITWNPVPGAIGYSIYGRAAGTPSLIATVGETTYSFVDTGIITPNVSVPPITSPVNLVAPATQFTVQVYDLDANATVPVETWASTLTDFTDDTGRQLEVTQQINAFSAYVNVASYAPLLNPVPTLRTTARVALAGGDSGTAPTNGMISLGLDEAFGDPEKIQINILINGGLQDTALKLAMISLAEKRGDTFAILDTPPQFQKAQAFIDYRRLILNANSSYAALYGPDLFEDDPYNGKKLYLPPSGFVAAIYARNDRVAGPQYAPAGLNRGLMNILGIREEYNESQRTALFQAQCNYVRRFIGSGISLFEQVTLQSKTSALSNISVRRMVNVIKSAVKDFLQFQLFEPNDDFTRRQIVQSVSDYLQFWKDARGILNFEVISDDTNNPAYQYNLGILKVTVFILPVIPVHEIQVDMVITKKGVSFSEINIQNLA